MNCTVGQYAKIEVSRYRNCCIWKHDVGTLLGCVWLYSK